MSSSVALVSGRGLVPLLRSIPALRMTAVANRNLATDKTKDVAPPPPPSPAAPVVDEAIHTGQQWSEEDVRNVRFMHRNKEVNRRWAIDLIKEVPPKEVNKRVVQCDGGGGALGHPRIYINLDSHEPVSCIYCGLRFVYKPH